MTPWTWFLREVVCFEGSTRIVALLRILLVLQAWSRFDHPLRLGGGRLGGDDPLQTVVTLVFWPASTLLLVGLWTRPAAIATAMCGFALFHGLGRYGGLDDLSSHHVLTLVIALGLLALTPCGRSLSVDRWLALADAERAGEPPPVERGPLYGQRLLAVHVAVIYLCTAWEKTYPGFLDGSRLQQIFLSVYFGSDGADPRWFVPFTVGSAWLVTAAEWVLPIGLFVRRWQIVLIPAGLVMHGLMYNLIPIATFSATMWILYLAFLDPDAFHQLVEDLT